MIGLMDYATSPLNPLLKIIIPGLFIIVCGIYIRIRHYYDGKIRSFIDMLLLFAVAAALAGVLRYFGHGTDFGFTEEYSLKWLQSIAYLFEAAFFIVAGQKFLHLFGGDDE